MDNVVEAVAGEISSAVFRTKDKVVEEEEGSVRTTPNPLRSSGDIELPDEPGLKRTNSRRVLSTFDAKLVAVARGQAPVTSMSEV